MHVFCTSIDKLVVMSRVLLLPSLHSFRLRRPTMSFFSVFRNLKRGNAVDVACRARFTQPHAEEFVIVKMNVIEVWTAPIGEQEEMEFVTSFEFFGEPNSINAMRLDAEALTPLELRGAAQNRLPEPGCDVLVLGLDQGKVSVVAYNPSRPQALRTIAIYNFEEAARTLKIGLVPPATEAFGARATCLVDPSNRCIVATLDSSFIAIIPLRRRTRNDDDREVEKEAIRAAAFQGGEEKMEEIKQRIKIARTESEHQFTQLLLDEANHQYPSDAAPLAASTLVRRFPPSVSKRELGGDHPLFLPPFILSLSRFGIAPHAVIDAALLPGARAHPTLAVLYTSPHRGSVGRVSVVRQTCALAVVSLVPESFCAHTARAWGAHGLPHDSFALSALPDGEGVLIFSLNAVQFVGPSPSLRWTMALNGFAAISCGISPQEPIHDIKGRRVLAVGGSDAASRRAVTKVLHATRRRTDPNGGKDDPQQEEEDEGEDDEEKVHEGNEVDFAITLERSRRAWLSPKIMLVIMSRGELLEIRLRKRGAATSLSASIVGAIDSSPSDAIALPLDYTNNKTKRKIGGHLLVTSRVGDSLLLKYEAVAREEAAVRMVGEKQKWKRSRSSSSHHAKENGNKGVLDAEDAEIYGSETHRGDNGFATGGVDEDNHEEEDEEVRYEVLQRFPNAGPILDMDFTDSLPLSAAGDGEDPEEVDERILKQAEAAAAELIKKARFSQAAAVRTRAQTEVTERRRRRVTDPVLRDLDLVTVGTRSRGGGACLSTCHTGIHLGLRTELHVGGEVFQIFRVWSEEERSSVLLASEFSGKTRAFLISPDGSYLREASRAASLELDRPTLFAHSFKNGLFQLLSDRVRFVPNKRAFVEMELKFEKKAQQEEMEGLEMMGGSGNEEISIASAAAEGGVLFILLSDGSLRMYEAENASVALRPVEVDATEGETLLDSDIACFSLLPHRADPRESGISSTKSTLVSSLTLGGANEGESRHPHLRLTLVRASDGTVEILEMRFNIGEASRVTIKRVFKSSVAAAVCPPALAEAPPLGPLGALVRESSQQSEQRQQSVASTNPLEEAQRAVDKAESGAVLGVMAHAKALDVALLHAPTPSDSRWVLALALADGELAVYTSFSPSREKFNFVRLDHGVLTRGLRGRNVKPRRVSPPPSRHFRAPLLVRLSDVKLFFLGQRPSFVLCGTTGKVTVAPLASSVAAPLPIPCQAPPASFEGFLGSGTSSTSALSTNPNPSAPPSSASLGLLRSPSTSSSSSSATSSSHVAPKSTLHLLPNPLDVAKVRGVINCACALGETEFVYSLHEVANAAVSTSSPATASSSNLRFCTLPSLLPEAQTVGDQALLSSRRNLPRSSGAWAATRVVYLPHASRGNADDALAGVHAPTFLVLTTRDEIVINAGDFPIPKPKTEILSYDDEKRLDAESLLPEPLLGGAPHVIGKTHALELLRSPDLHRRLSVFALDFNERGVCAAGMALDFPTEETTASQSTTKLPPLPGSKEAIASQRNVQRRNGCAVVGTGYVGPAGEDEESRARVLVFEIDSVRDEYLLHSYLTSTVKEKDGTITTIQLPMEEAERRYRKATGRPATKPRLRLACQVAFKGPISAVASLDGRFLCAMGNIPCSVKLLELNKRNGELGMVPVGFFDSPTVVVSLSVVRDEYVLCSDAHFSITFLRWRYRQFAVLGKHLFEKLRVVASDFFSDGTHLNLAAADAEGTLRLWSFDADRSNLEIKSEMKVGDVISKFKLRRVVEVPPIAASSSSSSSSTSATSTTAASLRSGIVAPRNALTANSSSAGNGKWTMTTGGLGGTLSGLLPIEERVFRRLDLLCGALASTPLLPKNGGLNPLSYSRVMDPTTDVAAVPSLSAISSVVGGVIGAASGTGRKTKSGSVIDGRVAFSFLNLDKVSQRKIAFSIGSTVETILDTLLEIDLMVAW